MTKDDEEKKTSKRVSRVPLRDLRGRNSKGSFPGPPGKKLKNKTGTYHWEKHIACFMYICNVRSQVFFPGVWVYLRDFYFNFYFFGSLEREPSLWENTWPWEILRAWENFPDIPLGNQDLWGGEKESIFDTGRRVEIGIYHWEGRKPFIQIFEKIIINFYNIFFGLN